MNEKKQAEMWTMRASLVDRKEKNKKTRRDGENGKKIEAGRLCEEPEIEKERTNRSKQRKKAG